MEFNPKSLIFLILAIVLTSLPSAVAQAPQSSTLQTVVNEGKTQAATFVFLQRTKGHVKYSKPDVFHNVLDDMQTYLNSHHVAMTVDEFGGRSHSEDEMTFSSVLTIARDSHADYLLYVLVDRPITKWIKITVQCFDISGKQLWQEESSSGGGMSGGHGLRVTFDRLHDKLDKRLGQPGLPITTVAEKGAEPAQAPAKPAELSAPAKE